jgi:hypothetical protein
MPFLILSEILAVTESSVCVSVFLTVTVIAMVITISVLF